MKHAYLQNFITLDRDAFAALTRHLGFTSAACYRLEREHWHLILATPAAAKDNTGEIWPPVATCTFDYTPDKERGLPLGWAKNPAAQATQDHWPKGANFYFPEQITAELKLLLVVHTPPGKRSRQGDLSAPLEVIASRIRSLLLRSEQISQLSEAAFSTHIAAIDFDLQRLIDHELRTPLASVAGYVALIAELDPVQQQQTWSEHHQIVQEHIDKAVLMLDKLSLALRPQKQAAEALVAETVDAAAMVGALCSKMQREAANMIGPEAAQRTAIRFHMHTDQQCLILANPKLFSWAIWEVIKNAVAYAKNGRIEVNLYCKADCMMLDIGDDGDGVAAGAEELIFLRFYQDTKSLAMRRGQRGLGMGLFLARRIVERHLGQLSFSRRQGQTGVFRFIWPLALDEQKQSSQADDSKMSTEHRKRSQRAS